jgi:hypothetical protein
MITFTVLFGIWTASILACIFLGLFGILTSKRPSEGATKMLWTGMFLAILTVVFLWNGGMLLLLVRWH